MKKVLTFVLLSLFAVSAYAADATLDSLQQQITDLQGQINTMSKRVDKNEVHRIKDKVDMGLELRSRVDDIHYTDMRSMPPMANDMMGLWLRGTLSGLNSDGTVNSNASSYAGASTGYLNSAFVGIYQNDFANLMGSAMQSNTFMTDFGTMMATDTRYSAVATAFNSAYAAYMADPTNATAYNNLMGVAMNAFAIMFSDTSVTAAEKTVMQDMFKAMKPAKYDHNNDAIFTNKLRIRMNSYVNENLSFTGRLSMYKTWGDATDVKWFNGQYNSMTMDGNNGAVPTDDKVRVERAYFVYRNELGEIPWDFSLGRRPSTYGPGEELHENAAQGGSPLAHIIQFQFDGASLQFNFENVLEFLPGSFIKLCYGRGYESGWGSSNAYGANNGLIATPSVQDVDFFGTIIKFYDDDTYKFWYSYARGFSVTDGFTGTTVMPYSITGNDTNLDGKYESYTFDMNNFGSASRMEATTKLGDMDWHSFLAQGTTAGFGWFASWSMSKSHPQNTSANAMYQFMGMDKMLGSDSSKTGSSVWVGVSTPELPYTGGKLGFEYNHGSKYWTSMTSAEDDLVGSKLAVRGDVYEAYYHQPIVGDKLFATLGYQYFNYDYTNSGSYLGAPVKISDANAFNTMTAVADKVEKFYASMTYRY